MRRQLLNNFTIASFKTAKTTQLPQNRSRPAPALPSVWSSPGGPAWDPSSLVHARPFVQKQGLKPMGKGVAGLLLASKIRSAAPEDAGWVPGRNMKQGRTLFLGGPAPPGAPRASFCTSGLCQAPIAAASQLSSSLSAVLIPPARSHNCPKKAGEVEGAPSSFPLPILAKSIRPARKKSQSCVSHGKRCRSRKGCQYPRSRILVGLGH